MTTPRQLAANRANAKLSTGPKTAAGKVRSRMNALKHALSAKVIVIGGEDPEQFENLRATLLEQLPPDSALAQQLVEQVATLQWRLRRIPVFEAAIFEALRDEQKGSAEDETTRQRRMSEDIRKLLPNLSNVDEYNERFPDDPLMPLSSPDEQARDDRRITGLALINDGRHQDALGKLSRYEASLMNQLRKTLQMLYFLQKEDGLTAKASGDHAVEQ